MALTEFEVHSRIQGGTGVPATSLSRVRVAARAASRLLRSAQRAWCQIHRRRTDHEQGRELQRMPDATGRCDERPSTAAERASLVGRQRRPLDLGRYSPRPWSKPRADGHCRSREHRRSDVDVPSSRQPAINANAHGYPSLRTDT